MAYCKPLISWYLVIFVLVLTGMRETRTVEGEEKTCSEGLGVCTSGGDCQQKCAQKHPSDPKAGGDCDSLTRPMLCTCYYSCGTPSPPPKKTCNGGAGICTAGCGDDCCSALCANKYPEGRGYCDEIVGTRLCQCQYTC